jgi:interferon gamma-inducible protein 30
MCIGFLILIVITLGIILVAWNQICQLDTGNPNPSSNEYAGAGTGTLNESKSKQGSGAAAPGDSETVGPDQNQNHLHEVEIYYEVLCPDSRHFILKNFNPAYHKLKDYIKPVFVPYGKASTVLTPSGNYQFDCQHGNEECLGNTIHACAVKYVPDEDELVSYIGCMINNNRKSEQIARKCASELGIDITPIAKCWGSKEGQLLLKRYGEMTHALRPEVSFIPTIAIDKSQRGQPEILKSVFYYLCTHILVEEKPAICNQ